MATSRPTSEAPRGEGTEGTDEPGAARIEVALFQPVLAHYRVDLFNAFDAALGGGLTLFTVSAPASTRLGGADDRLTCRRRRARTWTVGPLWCVPAALSQVWGRRWDVVVLSWNIRQVELLPALLLARLRGVPVVLWGHGLGQRRSRLSLAMRRAQARLAAAVVTYSDVGRRDVTDLVPGHLVTVLLNTTGRPPPELSDALVAPCHRITYLGRLLDHKRVDHLVEAVSRLRDEGLPLVLDILGDGPTRDVVEESVERHGLGHEVHWYGQVTEWPQVRDALGRSDMVVLPAGAGLAVVDAFAASRPVVVVDDAALNPPEADLVVEGDTGYRYHPCTVEGLTVCLRRIYDDPAGLVRTSVRAGAVYRDRLGLGVAAETFAEVVRTVHGPRRRAR